MLGADGFKTTFVFFLSSFFSLFFFFFLHHPTLFRWKRALRFASPGSALAPRFCYPAPELVEGCPRAFIILANAGRIHSLQLVSLDSRIRGNDGHWPPLTGP